uniref:Protein kinase domain-containing protein n=1 Tax=Steinernema glaseri TaxID=37863 RepID=A0A1I7ZPY5_9BILA
MASPEKENQSRSLHSFFDAYNRQTASRLSEPSRSSDHESDSPVKFGNVNRTFKPTTTQKNFAKKSVTENGKKCARKITDYMGFKTSPSKNAGGPVGILSGSDNSMSGAGDIQFSDSDVGESKSDTPKKSKRMRSDPESLKSISTQTVDEKPRVVSLDEKAKQLYEESERLKKEKEHSERVLEGYMATVMELLIKQSKSERAAASQKTLSNMERLGKFRPVRQNNQFVVDFIDGQAFVELEEKQKDLDKEREKVVAAGLDLRKRKQALRQKVRDRDGFVRPDPQPDFVDVDSPEANVALQDTMYQMMKEKLKTSTNELQAYANRLIIERELHKKEVLRQDSENASKFKDYGLLSKRYLPLKLAGKGGFSEVWQAYDLVNNIHVACKIHYVNPAWSATTKENYVRHVIRERDIQKSINHHHIVKLYDVFYIDADSYCTVLEFCEGDDLETYLKDHTLSEREATSVIQQMCNALQYISERKPPIIHYDLKPANILLDRENALEVKITDFGLSKIMDNVEGSIELTSLGAGTMWYLPPECFPQGPGASRPKICSKVDVWSVGVIFYQMLYGVKPFGNGESQKSIWQNGTIAKASDVCFPAKPSVSDVAKDFIRRCLQYDRERRADFNELVNHEIFKKRAKINFESDKKP